MPRTHADSNCNRDATLHATNPKPTYQSIFAKYGELHNLRTYMILRATYLTESGRITSPTHINREALEHRECNRERVDVARCLLRSALRSFCRKKFLSAH